MKRRSFLAMLGLAPVASAAADAPKVAQRDGEVAPIYLESLADDLFRTISEDRQRFQALRQMLQETSESPEC